MSPWLSHLLTAIAGFAAGFLFHRWAFQWEPDPEELPRPQKERNDG